MTSDIWHMVGGEHNLKIVDSQLLRFSSDSVLKILNERITYLNNTLNTKVFIEKPRLLRVC